MWILKAGDLFDNRYRIQREIGSGGMSYVYAALDEELQEAVALKIIRPELVGEEELVERFKREVRIARQILHPHVIRIFEFGRASLDERTLYYLTMELLPGADLASWLKTRSSITVQETLDIGLQICEALEEAHRCGVIHRDIKPQNIFIDGEGQTKLMDFGISRLTTLTGLTRGSQLMGTPRYMSPEQVAGRGELDHRTDIYSLGIVLYELCTQRVPFSGQTPVEVALRHIQEEPLPPRNVNARVPERLESVILKCLHKDPERRYASAAELRAALVQVRDTLDVETRVIPDADVEKSEPRGLDSMREGPPVGEILSLPQTTRHGLTTRSLPHRGLLMLTGGLALIGAVVIGLSLFILRSFDRQAGPGTTVEVETGEGAGPVVLPQGTATTSSPAGRPEPLVSAESKSVGPKTAPTTPEASAGKSTPASMSSQATGGLRIVCIPYASVLLDDEDVGYTPVNLEKVRAGPHRLVLHRKGYRTIQETVTIRPGEMNIFRFSLTLQ